jgi:hypothetical protein
VVASSKAVKAFLSDTSNLPYLMGFMTPAQRQVFATAVETNDGTTVGKMLTDQTLALVGTISTVGGAAKAVTVTSTMLKEAAVARRAADMVFGSAGKTTATEFVMPLGNAGGPAAEGVFVTQGLVREPLTFPDGVKMVNALQGKGLSMDEAIREARSLINSGATVPVAMPLDVTDRLVKVVPSGGAPSASTGYWMRESQLEALKTDPGSIASKLGLPPGMQVNSFDVFQITPKQGAVIYESKIAPTTVNGLPNTTGGASQTLVLDRSQFTVPVKTGTILIKK